MILNVMRLYDAPIKLTLTPFTKTPRPDHRSPTSSSRFAQYPIPSTAKTLESPMRRGYHSSLILSFALALTILGAQRVLAQQDSAAVATPPPGYFTVMPLKGVSAAMIHANVAAATTIPLWNDSITSPVDGLTYSGSMVGRS